MKISKKADLAAITLKLKEWHYDLEVDRDLFVWFNSVDVKLAPIGDDDGEWICCGGITNVGDIVEISPDPDFPTTIEEFLTRNYREYPIQSDRSMGWY